MRKPPARTVAALVKLFPTTIRVGSLTYRIEWWDDEKDSAAHSMWGQCDINTQVIGLARSHPSPSRLLATVVHELTHAIFGLFGWPSSPPDEEQVAHVIGNGWSMLLVDNPALGRWMLEAAK